MNLVEMYLSSLKCSNHASLLELDYGWQISLDWQQILHRQAYYDYLGCLSNFKSKIDKHNLCSA